MNETTRRILAILTEDTGEDARMTELLYSNEGRVEQCRRICELERVNAELRELCAGLLTGYECGYGELCKGCTWAGLGDSKTFPCLPRVKARELGVEVDE